MEKTVVTGIVLSATPIGDYDKRLVLLTKEYGKISAFARGARKPTGMLVAAANPFACGQFEIYEGKSSYSVTAFHAQNYFRELTADPEAAYYGFYFLELCDYYAREFCDERQALALLYQSLKALTVSAISHNLVRRVFELRLMWINGELPNVSQMNITDKDLSYTVNFIINTPIEKLYTFNLTEELLCRLDKLADYYRARIIDKRLHSLEILETLID